MLRSHAIIVAAATDQFVEHGYLGTSVDDIAARAGVSKRTIYNIFGGKEQLFREVVAQAVGTAERYAGGTAATLGDSDDVGAELRAAAVALARAVFGGRVVALRRLLIAETARFPELAADYYQRAPGRVMAALAVALRRVDRRNLLEVADPELAAEHFAFLTIGAALDRALFDASGELLSSDDVEARAIAGADAFLRAYAPTAPRGSA